MMIGCQGPGRVLNALHISSHLLLTAEMAGEETENEQWESNCPRSGGCKGQNQKSHPSSLKPEWCFYPKGIL